MKTFRKLAIYRYIFFTVNITSITTTKHASFVASSWQKEIVVHGFTAYDYSYYAPIQKYKCCAIPMGCNSQDCLLILLATCFFCLKFNNKKFYCLLLLSIKNHKIDTHCLSKYCQKAQALNGLILRKKVLTQRSKTLTSWVVHGYSAYRYST